MDFSQSNLQDPKDSHIVSNTQFRKTHSKAQSTGHFFSLYWKNSLDSVTFAHMSVFTLYVLQKNVD